MDFHFVSNTEKKRENDAKKKIKELAIRYRAWTRQYLSGLELILKAKDPGEDFVQEALRKTVFAGIKMINYYRSLRIERERQGLGEKESEKSLLELFRVLSDLFDMIGFLTVKNIQIAFPVTKHYDGDDYQCKDYFSTMEMISTLDPECQIGPDDILEFLWDYQNKDLSFAYLEYLRVMNQIKKIKTGYTFFEDWIREMGIEITPIPVSAKNSAVNKTNQSKTDFTIIEPKK